MKLYVGNLSYEVTDTDLHDLFAPYGEPDSAKVIMDRDSGRSKGFGFVEYSDNAKAQAAMSALSGKGTQRPRSHRQRSSPAHGRRR